MSTVTPNGAGGEYTEFNHPDRLGTRTITNQQSGTNSEQATLPFGTALNAESTIITNKNRFTSYDRSTRTGLDYAVNRNYDSKQGRFTQVDPIGINSSSLFAPQTLNLYSYCGNDPINHTDPSGLFWGFFKKLFTWVLAAIAVVVAVLTILAAPATIAGVLGAISAGANAAAQVSNAAGFKKIGMIFGLIAAVTGFGSIIAGKIGLKHLVESGMKKGIFVAGVWYAALGGVGAINNSLTNKSKPRTSFPCAPDTAQLIARFATFLSNLLEYASGHQTNSPLENGGWIYQRKNGDIFFLRAEKFGGEWRRNIDGINLGNPPNINGARVVAKAHTHPYSAPIQEIINSGKGYGGPSGGDVDISTQDQIPSIVAHQVGVTEDGRRKIRIEPAGSVWRINDKNCRSR